MNSNAQKIATQLVHQPVIQLITALNAQLNTPIDEKTPEQIQAVADAEQKKNKAARFKMNVVHPNRYTTFSDPQGRDVKIAQMAHPLGAVAYDKLLSSATAGAKVFQFEPKLDGNGFVLPDNIVVVLSRIADLMLLQHGGQHLAYKNTDTNDVAALYDMSVNIVTSVIEDSDPTYPPFEFMIGTTTYFAYFFPVLALPTGHSLVWPWSMIQPASRADYCHQMWTDVEGNLEVASLPEVPQVPVNTD